MQQTATSAPSSDSASFAGIIAALAVPAQKTTWNNDDGLEDDVATITYERSLRSQSRFKASEPDDQAFNQPDYVFTQPLDPDVLRFCEAIPDEADEDPRTIAPHAVSASIVDTKPDSAPHLSNLHHQNLKSASITIRLSKVECTQLRIRAAEAGLTVSAYLRSCTFEAESLRALVKDTLAQLRTTNATEDQKPVFEAKRSRFAWLHRLWPYSQNRQQIARA
jgi:hypothetical protein